MNLRNRICNADWHGFNFYEKYVLSLVTTFSDTLSPAQVTRPKYEKMHLEGSRS
jgi:hypothetical protein